MTVLTTMACVVTDAGITKPAFADVMETLQAKFKGIYGSDAYIDPDSQDGQWIAAIAKAIDDQNDVAVSIYNSMSPATGVGRALSNNVKINGIARAVATHSTVTLRCTGQNGTVLNACVATDANNNRWLIPNGTLIPGAGFIDVTATAEDEGAITATIGTITGIATPTLGWQAVTNTTAAAAGAPVETDAALRKRQAVSVALPSKTVLKGLEGAILNLPGVTACKIYENDTNVTDANGITAHTIAPVVLGGVAASIADTIMRKKTPGCLTQGTTSVGLTDLSGNAVTMRFYVPTQKRVIVGITIKALTGYIAATGDALKASLAAYVSALGIGKKVDLGRLYVPAQLNFLAGSGFDTYEVDALTIAFFGNALAAADLAIAFNEMANLVVGDITLTVT